MAFSQKLVQKQSQTFAMTQQLGQAIALLEMSAPELAQYIEAQLAENPLLAEAETESSDDTATDTPTDEPPEGDLLAESQFPSAEYPTEGQSHGGVEHFADRSITLQEHLISQMNISFKEPQELMLAQFLLENLEPTGYWNGNLWELSQRLGCTPTGLEKILVRCQSFDPSGIFARSLKECLQIQLRDQNLLTPPMERLLENLDLLAKGELPKLCQIVKVDVETLKEMVRQVRHCSPKPGLVFENTLPQVVIPDLYIVKDTSSGEWRVELNEEVLPKLLIRQSYPMPTNDHELRQYLQTCQTKANWLLKALLQRRLHMLKVGQAILSYQKEFFEEGVLRLKPLTLRQIAEIVDVHESTVSRITQHKYIQSPRGTVPMKYFFSAVVHNTWTGEQQSALQIQHLLKKLIQEESAAAPLSDEQLVQRLSQENIAVARRTVAKYRDLMKIPSAFERKRLHAKGF